MVSDRGSPTDKREATFSHLHCALVLRRVNVVLSQRVSASQQANTPSLPPSLLCVCGDCTTEVVPFTLTLLRVTRDRRETTADPNQPERLVGLITDGDLRRALRDHNSEEWASLKAYDLMTTDPITTTTEVLAVEAIKEMEHNRRKAISVLPVVNEDQQLQGLLRLHDLVQAGLA